MTATSTDKTPPAGRWPMTLLLVLGSSLAILALLSSTLLGMIGIWDSSSDTYAHGYVVLPISLWLIWRKRRELALHTPVPDMRALAVAALLCAGWLFGRAASAQVIEQYALVGLLITTVWALLGWRIVWLLLFPLAFLLMMVPVGEFMIMPMINFTADFTVFVLRAIGIPLYREGVFFSLPSGDWNVVTGCSGIRYFLSSVVLGLLFSYLNYRTWWKRLAFTAAAFIVPIVANGFRATMIVLIAHYSDMKLALGVDHFIYGWVWFGIVMLLMFWVGSFWREEEVPAPPPATGFAGAASAPRLTLVAAACLVATVAAIHLYDQHLRNRTPTPAPFARLQTVGGWQTGESFTSWTPLWQGTDEALLRHYGKGDDRVLLYLGWYGNQRQGSELVNDLNQFVKEKHPEWKKPIERSQPFPAGDASRQVRYALLKSKTSGQNLVALQWNRLNGHDSINPLAVKLELARDKLFGQDDSGASIIIAAPYGDKPEEAEAILARFMADMLPGLERALDSASP
ncbi:MAG: exosortase A [Pseudomonadota bacterium]